MHRVLDCLDDRPAAAARPLLARETRVTLGKTPRHLGNEPVAAMSWRMVGDEFLLRGKGDHYFHYRKGQGLIVERGPGTVLADEQLWLSGSVYAAIACINGLFPVHASAVEHKGRVFAFSGPPGAGKSTLIAALGDRGFPMVCDDTLVLDLADPACPFALPGHKRLKLSPQALRMTGATGEERVASDVDKRFARPAAGVVDEALPLAEIVVLEDGPTIALETFEGGAKLIALQDDHYTTTMFNAAQRFDRGGHFAHLARLAQAVAVTRFVRPRAQEAFAEGVDLVEAHIRRAGLSA